MHPLYNGDVLGETLSRLPFGDLVRCSQVSKFWRKQISKYFQGVVVSFGGGSSSLSTTFACTVRDYVRLLYIRERRAVFGTHPIVGLSKAGFAAASEPGNEALAWKFSTLGCSPGVLLQGAIFGCNNLLVESILGGMKDAVGVRELTLACEGDNTEFVQKHWEELRIGHHFAHPEQFGILLLGYPVEWVKQGPIRAIRSREMFLLFAKRFGQKEYGLDSGERCSMSVVSVAPRINN